MSDKPTYRDYVLDYKYTYTHRNGSRFGAHTMTNGRYVLWYFEPDGPEKFIQALIDGAYDYDIGLGMKVQAAYQAMARGETVGV
jgi:hypothetical protein